FAVGLQPLRPGPACERVRLGGPCAVPYSALALPPFDPTAEPEVTAYAVLELSFELMQDAGATAAA
ncbi:MAG TPA: hypothetical protein VGR29_03260, partial [Thermomicrobiales bacterium]|nr:hypothetical protein [Thermomicrobiales bacterium]